MYKSWHVQTIQLERTKPVRAHLGLDRTSKQTCYTAKTRTYACCSANAPLLRCTCTSLLVLCQITNLAVAIWALCPLFACCLLFFAFFCYLSFFLLFSVLLFSLFLLLSFLRWEKPKVTRLAHSRLELVLCQSC